jgi:peptidyl-prolyl cis-trans isomerase SurA
MAVWSAAQAQVVKAPRYSGTSSVEAPTTQIILPPMPTALTPHGAVVEDVVVQINDQIISRSDLERSAQQLQEEAQQMHATPEQFQEMQKNMLRDMIDQQLLLSRAKELGFNVDADVIRQLDDIRKKNNMASMDELEKAARAQGVGFEDFKAQIKNQLLTQQVVRDEVGRHLQMSQADETKYYEAHKSEFQIPEQVKLSEILVPLPENASAAEIAQAETKANGIKSQLMQGADFADLARKDSGGPSAAQGGELGLFKRGALAQILEDQTFSLKPGESTQPIRTRQGFVILKVTQHDLAGPAPMKDVEPQIQERMYMDQMQPALRVYLTKLRGDAYIDMQPGFVDSGATGNESKLINTAYVPPPVKKKVEKAKSRFTPAPAKAVVASPDTTGGRTITGTDADATPVTAHAAPPATATATDPNTGLARLAATKTVNGKVTKVKKEKIRFGQAPRNALPGGGDATEAAVVTPASGSAAPATEVASASPESANLADNPLTPKAPELKKTRFSARAAEEKAKKANTLSAKAKEKILAKPLPASSEEKATEKIQAAPLSVGANDEAKKQPKPKKVKGQAKERLAEKPATTAPTTPQVEQTANPKLAPTDATPPTNKPSSDQTTLPGTSNPPPNTPPPTTPTTPPPPSAN